MIRAELARPMSALPHKRTSLSAIRMSALCHRRHWDCLDSTRLRAEKTALLTGLKF